MKMQLLMVSRIVRTTAVLMLGWLSTAMVLKAQATPPVAPASLDVEIWVEGPWAYADDPTDAKRIVLIAPNPDNIDHTMPAVGNRTGDYELQSMDSVIEIDNLQPNPQTSSINPYPVTFAKQSLIKLLSSGTDRYVIYLPKPDSYEESVQQEARIHSTWWDDCRPSGNCGPQPLKSNQMILHYTVPGSQTQFKVGPLNNLTPLYFRDRHVITVFMTPEGQMDPCDSGGRLTFRALMLLFSAQLYVDLREKDDNKYPSDDKTDQWGCLADDPQNPANNDLLKPTSRITRPLASALGDLENYIVTPNRRLADQALADWNQINRAGNLVGPVESQKRQTFNQNMATIDSFLKSLDGKQENRTQVSPIDALRAVQASRKLIPFHNGSGACRNPLIKLNVQ